MRTIVKKWGNSLAIRIPKEVARSLNVSENKEVSFEKKGNNFLLKIVKKKKEETLEEMCARITPENRPEVIDWGPPVGREAW